MCELTRTLRTALLTAALVAAGVAPAAATFVCTAPGQVQGPPSDICQEAQASQTSLNGASNLQPPSDVLAGDHGTGVVPNDIVAEIPPAGAEPTQFTGFATASVGRFGAIGLNAMDFSGSQTDTVAHVTIQNDRVYVNSSSITQHILQHLIIDGGSMSVAGTRNTVIIFEYKISANGLLFDESAALTTDSLGKASFQFTTDGGIDLGIVFDPVTEVATIPLSAQTLDLGFLLPGDGVAIDFFSGFHLQHLLGGTGTLTAHYSDPFHLSANSALGIVAAETAGAVPEPATWVMMLLGFAGLGFAFRQSRRKVSMA
jgi:hypothetical protein